MPLNPPPSSQSFDTTTTTPTIQPPPPPPPGSNPNELSHNGVVNFEALKRDRQRTEAKYHTHHPTPDSQKNVDAEEEKQKTYSEEDKSLLDAVKGVGEALHLSGKPGGK